MILGKLIDGEMWMRAGDHHMEMAKVVAEKAEAAESWQAAVDCLKQNVIDWKAKADALQGQVAEMRGILETLADYLGDFKTNPSLDIPDEIWCPVEKALDDTEAIAAAHDASIREECAKHIDVPYICAGHDFAKAIRSLKTAGAGSDDK